ncbi:hypothetical protein K504DRAFT_491334 [Pleomassaria siparia CBS 279.74]|uniref:Uncharacterized protein n=1 Tax=Pleomassaria siparia CBS 279.74 TaxID=1314801 RepID=A0A6G1K7P3_9PLEO|nr:hypothetical protein K504DRAFT_491334 [Pleomassaria siparia CBS 279.74]
MAPDLYRRDMSASSPLWAISIILLVIAVVGLAILWALSGPRIGNPFDCLERTGGTFTSDPRITHSSGKHRPWGSVRTSLQSSPRIHRPRSPLGLASSPDSTPPLCSRSASCRRTNLAPPQRPAPVYDHSSHSHDYEPLGDTKVEPRLPSSPFPPGEVGGMLPDSEDQQTQSHSHDRGTGRSASVQLYPKQTGEYDQEECHLGRSKRQGRNLTAHIRPSCRSPPITTSQKGPL